MICCICQKEIKPNPYSGWDRGHNPDPVRRSGRCCDGCNVLLVLPARIKRLKKAKKARRGE